jgi:hypothetical protein
MLEKKRKFLKFFRFNALMKTNRCKRAQLQKKHILHKNPIILHWNPPKLYSATRLRKKTNKLIVQREAWVTNSKIWWGLQIHSIYVRLLENLILIPLKFQRKLIIIKKRSEKIFINSSRKLKEQRSSKWLDLFINMTNMLHFSNQIMIKKFRILFIAWARQRD